jgi:hypothetical protein
MRNFTAVFSNGDTIRFRALCAADAINAAKRAAVFLRTTVKTVTEAV